MSDKFKTLDQICDAIIDCPHSTPQWLSEGVRVVRNFNLRDGLIDFSNGFFVDEDTFSRRVIRATPAAGDIIFSREAPIGAVGIVPKNLKCCLGQRVVLLKPNRNICHPYFLLGILMSNFAQTQFNRANLTGSTVSNLTIPDLKELKVPWIENNFDVGHFIQQIQDKLELNLKLNFKLFNTAMSIYMFRFHKRLPNGTIGEILSENPKSIIQVGQAKAIESGFPFYTSGESIYFWHSKQVEGRNILLNTGGNADVKFHDGAIAYSTDTWCVKGVAELTDYLFLLLSSIKHEIQIKFFQGTGLKHLQKNLLKQREIYIPNEAEVNEFNLLVSPILSLINKNKEEYIRLVTLRNSTLELLINGRVKF